MVHCNTFVPRATALTVEAANVGFTIVANPETKVQLPVPIAGTFAARVASDEHSVCVTPAFAGVGIASASISTVEVEGGQTPLEMVHIKIFVPVAIEVTDVFANVGVVIVPLPKITVQLPVPIAGTLPESVAELAQTD